MARRKAYKTRRMKQKRQPKRPTPPHVRVKHPSRATLLKTLRLHERRLMSLPNVHHVGVAEKIQGGRRMVEQAITVYVTRKANVPTRDRVPKKLKLAGRGANRSIRTDVCELKGIPQLFGMRGGNQILASDMETGTAGLVFRHRNKNYFLTNAHVVSDPGQTTAFTVFIPPPFGGNGQVVWRDTLSAGGDITSDAALVLINAPVDSWQFYNSEKVMTGFADTLAIGQTCEYVAGFGPSVFTFQCRLIAFVPGIADIQDGNTILRYRSFYRFQVLNGQPVNGHSGALMYVDTGQTLLAAGLVFGGIPGQEIWAFPARRCYDRMMKFFKS